MNIIALLSGHYMLTETVWMPPAATLHIIHLQEQNLAGLDEYKCKSTLKLDHKLLFQAMKFTEYIYLYLPEYL